MRQINITRLKSLLIAVALTLGVAAGAQEPEQAPERENKVTKVVNSWSKHFQFHGYMLAGWQYREHANPSNEFLINKVILFTDITVIPRLTGRVMFSVNKASLLEAWAAYQVVPEFGVKIGQFKTPFSMENPYSPTVLELITENGLVTQHMVMGADSLMMPGCTGRDIGITVYGSFWRGRVNYDLALMNGAGRNCSDINNAKDFVARLSVRPVSMLEVGGSVIVGRGSHPSMGGRFKRNRYAASAQLTTKPVVLRAEYMWGVDGDEHSDGGYAMLNLKNVGVRGLDLAATADHLRARGVVTNRVSAGASYWFYPGCRLQLEYSHSHAYHVDSNAVYAQVQLAF